MAIHELGRALGAADCPLHGELVGMLDEHPSHRTERRGCGYTQATRYLAALTNRRAVDPQANIAQALFAQPELATRQFAAIHTNIEQGLRLPESRLILCWINGLLATAAGGALPVLQERPKVGSCPLAEQYFLELAHGRLRRGGSIRLWSDPSGQPLLIEKIGLGDNQSAVSIRPLQIAGVDLPAGTLFALAYPDSALDGASSTQVLQGSTVSIARLSGAFVLRLTTLALAPADRPRAFSSHFQLQVTNALYSPDTTTIDDLRALADRAADYR